MKTFVFPGQGSQVRGMGGSLFSEFKDLTAKADEILGYSIEELCLKDPQRQLNQTQFTQPALYVVNALSYFKKLQETNTEPDYVAGHSLGEFNALLAAGGVDFETGLKLVQKRGALMSEATGGGMAAILNASEEQIVQVFKEFGLTGIDFANYNTASQIVVSGLKDDITQAQPLLHKGDVKFLVLNTSGAFHSRYMQPAQEEFAAFLKGFQFSQLKIPIISNVTAQPYRQEDIQTNLANQIISPVKWSASIHYLMEQGDMAFEEVGHGEVLTKMVRKIQEERSKLEEPAPVAEEGAFNPISSMPLEEKIAYWNKHYPIGTKVKSMLEPGELETRTEAQILFGHRAAIYLKGFNGYFDLDEIRAL